MSYTSKLKKSLNKCLDNITARRDEFCQNPNSDFTRNRKSDFSSIMKAVLCFGGKSLNKELFEIFGFNPDTLSASAFVQQRSKIKPEAFYQLFIDFINSNQKAQLFHGYRLLAVDGSDIYTPKNKNDFDSLSKNQNSTFNLYHLNALYDLLANTYSDAIVQKYCKSNEHKAYVCMVDRCSSKVPAIFISDRGYESYNNMAHVQENGQKFLTRLKDIKSNGLLRKFDLPDSEFDISIDLNLTRKQTNPVVFYTLHLRFVRIQVTEDLFEVLVTNLDEKFFSPSILKQLYSMRWGIETSFRKLKYTVGLSAFHSKKPEHILQEIFARLTLYNFSELVTSHIAIRKKKRKHIYKINFSVGLFPMPFCEKTHLLFASVFFSYSSLAYLNDIALEGQFIFRLILI